jgi:hypothetical protein
LRAGTLGHLNQLAGFAQQPCRVGHGDRMRSADGDGLQSLSPMTGPTPRAALAELCSMDAV